MVADASALPPEVRALYPFESHVLGLPDGNRLHYVDEGEGEPVVLLHGNPTWSFLYRRFIEHYRDGRRCVAPDHIGFGLSSKPTDGGYYSIERHASNFGALMEGLDLRDVTLVLQDWGGPIGMAWAVSHRERVKRLVVLDTLLAVEALPVKIPLWFRVMRSRPLGELLFGRLNLFVRGFVERRGTKRDLTDAEKAAYRLPFRSAAERAGVVAFPRLIPTKPGDRTYDLIRSIEEALPAFDVPALMVSATDNPTFSQDDARSLAALIPRVDGPHFVEASHYLQEDAPAAILSHMDRFLEANP